MIHEHYPSQEEVDRWCDDVRSRADGTAFSAKALDVESYAPQLAVRHTKGNGYVEFTGEFDTFWGYWQPAHAEAPAPLLIHLPGYSHEVSAHPELVTAGYSVLHISPRGYATPTGPDETKRYQDSWPVLPDTVTSLGEEGYVDWLRDALVAVRWAISRDDVDERRVGVFGSSNGGGTAALVTSILGGDVVRALAADVIFLTSFPGNMAREEPGAYWLAKSPLDEIAGDRPDDLAAAWKALGFVDTLSHSHRLTMPTMLVAGGDDACCPPESIRELFDVLPGTRSYSEIAGQCHGHTVPFLRLAASWFGLYV